LTYKKAWKEGDNMDKNSDNEVRKRNHLSPEEKFQIFIEATMAKARGNGNVSEVLRHWGIHANDLTRIRKVIEEGAISNFKARKSRKPKIDYLQHQELKAEKERLESTVLEQAAELALLKKKDRSA
jgi:transposase-like protein